MPEEIKPDVKPEQTATSLLDEAKQSAKELKELIAEQKKIAGQLENLKASEILKGKSEAGVIVQPVVETPQDYCKRIMGGRL